MASPPKPLALKIKIITAVMSISLFTNISIFSPLFTEMKKPSRLITSATRLSKKSMGLDFGSPGIPPARPVAFRPTLTGGLAFRLLSLLPWMLPKSKPAFSWLSTIMFIVFYSFLSHFIPNVCKNLKISLILRFPSNTSYFLFQEISVWTWRWEHLDQEGITWRLTSNLARGVSWSCNEAVEKVQMWHFDRQVPRKPRLGNFWKTIFPIDMKQVWCYFF